MNESPTPSMRRAGYALLALGALFWVLALAGYQFMGIAGGATWVAAVKLTGGWPFD